MNDTLVERKIPLVANSDDEQHNVGMLVAIYKSKLPEPLYHQTVVSYWQSKHQPSITVPWLHLRLFIR